MKKTFRLIFAAAFCGLAFTSCTQESLTSTPAAAIQGTRVIKATFAPTTRTELDGLQPAFKEGDEILVANLDEEVSEVCQIIGSGENAYFSTTIKGDLCAFYPAKYAQYNGGKGGINWFIPEEQNGKFEDANEAGASIPSSSDVATFYNQTALLIITPPEGTKQFTVRSLKPIGVDGQRSGTAKRINAGKDEKDTLCITVGDGTEALGTFYVSMLEGANLSDLSFDTGSALKGIPENDIKAQASALGKTFDEANQIKRGSAYTITNENWHPYVKIGGKKWATMNVGATTVAGSPSTSYGDYFAWGETTPRYIGISINGNDISFSGWKTGFSNGYSEPNPEYTDAVLDVAHDAATQNLGSSWRTPAYQDFLDLYRACGGEDEYTYIEDGLPKGTTSTTEKGIYWCRDYDGVKGLLCSDGDIQLFFPACGYIGDTRHSGSNHYWSSTHDSEYDHNALDFQFGSILVSLTGSYTDFFGFSIRPISD